MDLDEAIKHCEEVAIRERDLSKADGATGTRIATSEGCLKCAEEHEQLAEWLTQLKRIKEAYKTGEVMNIVAECMSIWGE